MEAQFLFFITSDILISVFVKYLFPMRPRSPAQEGGSKAGTGGITAPRSAKADRAARRFERRMAYPSARPRRDH
jgi:hypothetical protein